MREILEIFWDDELGILDENYEKNIFDAEFAALAMAANYKNYKTLLSLKTYKEFLQISDLYELKMQQVAVLNSLKNSLLNPAEIEIYYQKLLAVGADERFLSYLKNFESCEIKSVQNEYEKNQNELKEIYEKLGKILPRDLKKRLDEYFLQFINKDFKIAFSGVFNAGKSSLINALLGRDILGVSNAPETANLSVISSGESEKIKVNFYEKSEFEQLKEQAILCEELADIFDKEYQKYESVEDKIENIYQYTSANSEKSLFVKDIAIELKNEFLGKNIKIIDTPGLDDVVISREQISLNFLKSANCVLYLMNATQALSLKDMQFLLEFCKNNPSTKLILLLTKSDLVDADELIKLKIYTKNRFTKELENNEIKANFELFCVSASEYKKDKKLGEIERLKQYLRNEIFNSAATKSFSDSIASKFVQLIDAQLENLQELKNTFNLDKANEQNLLEKLKNEAAQKEQKRANLQARIDEFLVCDYSIGEHEITHLAKNLESKIQDEINYDKNYSNERAKTLINQATSDLLSAAMSSKKALFLKEFSEIKKHFSSKKELEFDFFNPQELIQNFAKITQNFDFLEQKNKISEKISAILHNVDLSEFRLEKNKEKAREFFADLLACEFANGVEFCSKIDNNLQEKTLKDIEILNEIKGKLL